MVVLLVMRAGLGRALLSSGSRGRSRSGLGERRTCDQGNGNNGDEVLEHRFISRRMPTENFVRVRCFSVPGCLIAHQGRLAPVLQSARIITENSSSKCRMTAK
jgi:hypothetical protein